MTVRVVAALLWNGQKFLVCRRPAHKARGLLWEFVGGKVEPGETPEQALVRECREELCIGVQPGQVFMQVQHTYPDITIDLTLFHAEIKEGTPQLTEHIDMRWVTPQEAMALPFCPADIDILQELCSRYTD